MKNRLYLFVLTAVLALASALEIVGPWLTKIALDDAIPGRDGRLLGLLAVGYLGTMVVAFTLQYGQRLLTTWLGQRIMYDLRKEIFHKYQTLDLRYFDRNPVGRLITRITSDVETTTSSSAQEPSMSQVAGGQVFGTNSQKIVLSGK